MSFLCLLFSNDVCEGDDDVKDYALETLLSRGGNVLSMFIGRTSDMQLTEPNFARAYLLRTACKKKKGRLSNRVCAQGVG